MLFNCLYIWLSYQAKTSDKSKLNEKLKYMIKPWANYGGQLKYQYKIVYWKGDIIEGVSQTLMKCTNYFQYIYFL